MALTEKQLENLAAARQKGAAIRAAFAAASNSEKAEMLRARAEKLSRPAAPRGRPKKSVGEAEAPQPEAVESQQVEPVSEPEPVEALEPVETVPETAPEPEEPKAVAITPKPVPPKPKPVAAPPPLKRSENIGVFRDGKRRRRIIILDSDSDDDPTPQAPQALPTDDFSFYRRLGLF